MKGARETFTIGTLGAPIESMESVVYSIGKRNSCQYQSFETLMMHVIFLTTTFHTEILTNRWFMSTLSVESVRCG